MTDIADRRHLTPESENDTIWNLIWWNRRTKLELTLLIVTVTSLLLVSVTAVALATLGYLYQKNIGGHQSILVSSNINNQLINNSFCLTPGCVKAAAEILRNIDEKVDPCDDFYRFACGGWINRQKLTDDESSISTLSMLSDTVTQKLRVSLEKQTGSEPEFIKMVKRIYDSCMDIKSLEKSGSDPLKNVLKSLGGWPVVEGREWRELSFNWIDTLIAIRKLGYNHKTLLSLSVMTYSTNNTLNTITLNQPSLGISDRSYLLKGLNDSITSAYFKMMVKSAMLLGVDKVTSEKELLDVLKFETALANISMSREELRTLTVLDTKYTIKMLQQDVPQIHWLKYFNGILNDEVYENETFIMFAPDFIRKFADLITSTDERIIANYMLWRVVHESFSMLSKDWRDIAQENMFVVTGQRQQKSRWMQCLGHLKFYLKIALSSYYVRQYFKEESKDATLELVMYIQNEFIKLLKNIDWMEEATKKKAIAKVRSLKSYVGYPKELLNNTAVMEFYKNLTIISESYFKNMLSLEKWKQDGYIWKLRKLNVKGDWREHGGALIANAYAYLGENSMEIPAGILQNPFFSRDRPQYLNFGSIGFVIGHEITHGFDDSGKKYDKDGNFDNWWDKKTDELFNEKAQCIIDQYSNFTENGMKVNGVNTQGENIADNGGLKEAYWAYHSWVKDHGKEQLLPGVKFTQSQMFWISAATVFCVKERPEVHKHNIVVDEHSPNRFRIIGTMSNLPEFAKEFNCPLDSLMNKKERCEVW